MKVVRQMSQSASVLILLIGVFLADEQSSAHVDTEFPIGADGILTGIPEKYGPISISVGRPASAQLQFTFGQKVIDIPKCLIQQLPTLSLRDIRAAGSWYHGTESGLPPYIHFRFARSFDDYGVVEDGYELMFNLETGELIGVTDRRFDETTQTLSLYSVYLSDICSTQDIQSLSSDN